MSITKNVLAEIKEDLQPYLGSSITLQANKGRKKVVERTGVLDGIYPNIFIVKIKERATERKVSFCYSDILTYNVVLTSGEDKSPIEFKSLK